MEKIYYDLHIHSCLSPCGDDDMTPNNIVNMALLKGLDLIALTDHNSCANGAAVQAAAARALKEWNGAEEQTEKKENGPKPAGADTSSGPASSCSTDGERRDGQDSSCPADEERIDGEAHGGGRHSGRELILLYGAEVETEEEVHVLCLFSSLEQAKTFEQGLSPWFSQIKNRISIYGEQWIMDEDDRVVGDEQRLLASANSISFQELFRLTDSLGGAFVPAHIDKQVYSVLSNMGFIPEELPIAAVEVSPAGVRSSFLEEHPEISSRYRVITSSDAHYLWDIAERERYLETPERTAEAVIRLLKCGEGP